MQGLLIVLLAGAAFLVAMLALTIANRSRVPRDASSLTRDAQRILDERLARGEIGIDEYLARSAALRGDRPNGTQYRPDEPSDDGPPAEPDEDGPIA
ncbi:MAG: hypothetical protein LCH76_02585 [Actinobacteria bacterium]|nr:hypothetical protein [Actinomycetota bacterium]